VGTSSDIGFSFGLVDGGQRRRPEDELRVDLAGEIFTGAVVGPRGRVAEA